jgi:hypothetical protein
MAGVVNLLDELTIPAEIKFIGNTKIEGNLTASMFSGSGRGLFDIPRSAITEDSVRIASGSATASIAPDTGFIVITSFTSSFGEDGSYTASIASQFTGSVSVSGSLFVNDVSGGLFFSVADVSITEASGNVFVNLMASHCAKDFTRKHKIPCEDNKRSMLRLRRECENAMKSLSTGAEAMIDIDSLCEGIDFSLKLSKARFEDLIAVPIMHLKNAINTLLQNAGWSIDAVEQVCLSGGGSAIPKAMTTLKSLFPEAKFLVGRFESSEAQCIGAASHGKYLVQQVGR